MQSVLDTRVLGSDGLVVPALGIGCSSRADARRDAVETMAMLHLAFDLGLTFIDSEPGAEPFLVRAIKGRRNKIVLSVSIDDRGESAEAPRSERRPAHLASVVDGLLHRLGLDHLDLVSVEPSWTPAPVEDLAGGLADMVRAGKVRFMGLVRPSAHAIRRANDVHSLSAVHHDYSVWERDVESAVAPVLRELGIGLIAHPPVGDDSLWASVNPRLHETLRVVARAHDATPGQVALAWLLHRSGDIVPALSVERRSNLLENVEAIDLTLGGGERTLIDAASALQPMPLRMDSDVQSTTV